MDAIETEVPGTSVKKKRNPQTRDIRAAKYKGTCMDLGSGKSMERAVYAARKSVELREQGHTEEAQIMQDAINTSKRGAYEIARMPDDAILALCQIVIAGDARNLIEARRMVQEIIRRDNGINEKEVKLLHAKNGMYRLVSGHNKSSALLSAQDLIELSELLVYILPDLQIQAAQEKASEDLGTSPE